MDIALFALCIVAGIAIYFVIVRPFLIPLEWRIPTSRAYQPTLGAAPTRR